MTPDRPNFPQARTMAQAAGPAPHVIVQQSGFRAKRYVCVRLHKRHMHLHIHDKLEPIQSLHVCICIYMCTHLCSHIHMYTLPLPPLFGHPSLHLMHRFRPEPITDIHLLATYIQTYICTYIATCTQSCRQTDRQTDRHKYIGVDVHICIFM